MVVNNRSFHPHLHCVVGVRKLEQSVKQHLMINDHVDIVITWRKYFYRTEAIDCIYFLHFLWQSWEDDGDITVKMIVIGQDVRLLCRMTLQWWHLSSNMVKRCFLVMSSFIQSEANCLELGYKTLIRAIIDRLNFGHGIFDSRAPS